jgi:hypothetical protein
MLLAYTGRRLSLDFCRLAQSKRKGDGMPFQEFAPFFGPDELEAMTTAYNSAWYQLWLAGIAVTTHPQAIRKKLAQVILAAACTGKRDQNRLEEIAIRALSHP